MKGMKSLQKRVTGNPESNIVYYTCRNLEKDPSIEISLSSVTALFMSRCTRMHLLHKFSASVKNSLLFFLWIWKSEPMPWNTVNCRLFAIVENAFPKSPTMHLTNILAQSKWRISALTYEPSSSIMGRYHGCKQRKKKRPNISPTENNMLPSCLN